MAFKNHGTVRKAVGLEDKTLDDRELRISKARSNPWKKGLRPGQWEKRGQAKGCPPDPPPNGRAI